MSRLELEIRSVAELPHTYTKTRSKYINNYTVVYLTSPIKLFCRRFDGELFKPYKLFYNITAEILAHWLIFIVNMRTDL